ncbi:hypothetical protein BLNAU_1537 [Blattamonas nauphoetae]|uniref:Doublecortin domain-containing protein n=1 Tax=Blattamonas nauphoetae TaxID=2049346 RepID=A0ABQ9YIB3_9EUKA|nr:hypothetical protein BLNAU_1537 [Blattamonas nauphoetae]
MATPITILVFRNGDTHHTGTKITLKATIKTMQQLYDVINKEVQLVTGACRKVVTPAGKQIANLVDFTDGGKYIALAGEPLNKEKLPTALKPKAKPKAAEPTEIKPELEKHTVAKHEPTKFGTQSSKPKTIYVFRNGDKHDQGTKITLKAIITTMDKLYDVVNKEVRIVTGACRKIVTPAGKAIAKLEDFEDEGKYIACAGEPLNKEAMSTHI